MELLDISVQLWGDFLLARLILGFSVRIFTFLNYIEKVHKFVEILLAKRSTQVNNKGQRNQAEDILMQVFAQFRHALNQLILSCNESMILEVIHQVLLTMFVQKVELDLAWRWSPLKVIQSLRRLNQSPARSSIHDPFHHVMVIAQKHDIFVKLRRLLLIQGEQIVLGLDLPFSLKLLP